jgi:hypothetical protein
MRFRYSSWPQVLTFLAMLAFGPAPFCQTPPSRTGAPASETGGPTENDKEMAVLIERFVLNGSPGPLNLKPEERARMIKTLLEAQQSPNIRRPFLNHYLLALVGYNYEQYRDEFLQQWSDCCADGGGWNNEISGVLIRLYQQNHKELLRPLLAGGRSDEAMQNDMNLGEFYRQQLERNPRDFVAALGTFTPAEQQALCTAAAQSGNGLEAKGESKVIASLKLAGGEVAGRCAAGVQAGVEAFKKRFGFPPPGP